MEGEFVELGPDAPLNWISEQDSRALGFNCWDPIEYEKRGWKRNWGDAAVMEPWFEVLRREVPNTSQTVEFMVLCPTFLRRPLKFMFSGAWGSY